MNNIKVFWMISFALGLGLLIYFPGGELARSHVNEKTAVTDHPLTCTNCHLYITKNEYISKLVNEDYLSPLNLTVSEDGKHLFVVAQDGDAVLKLDTQTREVVAKTVVGDHPHSVILDPQKQLLYVSNQWSDNVSVLDAVSLTHLDTLQAGNGPSGLALSADNKRLYVVNTFSSSISVLDIASEKEIKRLRVGDDPTGIAISQRDQILVGSRRARLSEYGVPLETDLVEIDSKHDRLKKRIPMSNAYMIENIAFTPSSDLALTTLIRPKNNIPSVQVESGWMMTHGIGLIENRPGGKTAQLLIDEPNSYYPDPYDIEVTPDGKKAFVSSSGVNVITVVDVDSLRNLVKNLTQAELDRMANDLDAGRSFIMGRIRTGAGPKGMVIAPNGKYLYVAEQLEDRVAVIDVETLENIGSIDLGGPDKVSMLRQGRKLFANAGHTFQNQYSCYTCHPDNHEDGLVYNMAGKHMGRNLANTQSLREIGDTAPFKWNGKNQTVYKQDGMRFSTILTRTEAFSYKDLDAITAYIMRGIEHPPNLQYNPDGNLTASQERGKVIFERTIDNNGDVIPEINRCVTCHPAPLYTNRQMADVSTLAETDDPMLFDTPHLTNLFASPPYLHDGRAKTLEEIWTVYAEDDRHGRVNDLTKPELNDLINYLKSLRSPKYMNDDEVAYHEPGS
jgi:YVTN family beta-propeller protein